MLRKLEITGLFGLYDYRLDFTADNGNYLKIVTGPNGYGKTTVLQMVHALFSKDVATFLRVPFSSIAFSINDDIVRVRQHRRLLNEDEASDLPCPEAITVFFELMDAVSGKFMCLQEIAKGEEHMEINGELELLLNSFQCFFLTDERILLRKSEQSEIEHNASSDHSMNAVVATIKEIMSRKENEQGIDLFRDLVSFFKFADKEMVLDKTFGIRFRMNNASKTMIPVTALSSGERHLLLQLFELIFNGKSGDLVMIDEPELSFHPAWLNEYVSVLEKIQRFKHGEGRDMQIILATHSPVLIGERWDETLDLYTLRENG